MAKFWHTERQVLGNRQEKGWCITLVKVHRERFWRDLGWSDESIRTKGDCPTVSNPSNEGNPLIGFNSNSDKLEFIEQRKYRIEKDKNTGWYRWTCKNGNGSGIESTKSGAKKAGKEACGIANFDIDEVLVTKLMAEYQESDYN